MPRERDPNRVPMVPPKVRAAIGFMLEQKADMASAALHAQIHISELRRYLGKPHVLRYAREQKKAALEALCLTSPAYLLDVLKGENEMAKVNAIKTAEALRVDAVEIEQRAVQRAPGLQIVIVQSDGSHHVAYQPPQPVPMLDVTPGVPVPEAEPVIPEGES